jgi:uncharacterized protein
MKTLIYFLSIIAGSYVLICILLHFNQERFIFFPEKLPADYRFQFEHTFQEVTIQPGNGTFLHALYFEAEDPVGVIIYFHGNAGSLRSWGLVADDFIKRGYNVLMPDYRTYGKSRGRLSERNLLNDAALWYREATRLYKGERLPAVYGRSIGASFALYVACNYRTSEVVLESPFYSLPKVAGEAFPYFPVSMLLKYEFPNYHWILSTGGKVHIIHGTEDDIIAYENSQMLAAIDPGRIILKPVKGAGHNNIEQFDAYQALLDELFLNEGNLVVGR